MPPEQPNYNEIERRRDEHDLTQIKTRLEYIAKDLDSINEKLAGDYVTQDQFWPVRAIVFTMVGTILLGVLGALLTLILKG